MMILVKRLLGAKSFATVEAVALVVVILYSYNQHDRLRTQRSEMETMRVALENPRTVEVVKTVTVQGPVRVKTIVVEKPTGEKQTTTIEERGEVKEIVDNKSESEPVSLAALSVNPRQNRWLAGLSNRGFEFSNTNRYGAWGGYSFKNRLDVLIGIADNPGFESSAMVVFRF